MTPADFIAAIAPAARACYASTGIPASFTIAQAALESSWGKSELAQRAHNLFGVKADAAWRGPTISMDTGEVINGKHVIVPAQWRSYPDWLACLTDRAAFFHKNPRYAKCFAETTGEGWCRAVAAAGYATDPLYAHKIITVIHGRNLSLYDQP